MSPSNNPMDELLVARNLSKSFGETRAVRGLDLAVAPGEIFGLVGPDGAGKTTTIRLLCGVLSPDTGEVLINGISMSRNPDEARASLGYLSQRFSLYDELTVLENLRFFAEVRGMAGDQWRDRTMEILEFVGLLEFINRRARYLSGGMKQKLGLASALVHRPRLLLLDEPTGGVDPVTRQDFWQLILRLVTQDQIAVLVSTPYMDEATRCAQVGFMKSGRLVVSGAPRTLRDGLTGRILELYGQRLPALRALASADPDVETVQSFGDRLHLRVRPGTLVGVQQRLTDGAQTAGFADLKLQPIEPQLEDVFIEILETEHGRD